jgi:hypothetical protein
MFFSTFPYVLRHISEGHLTTRLGEEAHSAYPKVLQGQLTHPTWPCFLTLRNARAILRASEELAFYELGATIIHQARCRAAGAFLRSGQDVWVSCDEDVEAGEAALRTLTEHVERTRGAAFAAYRLRGDGKWSVGAITTDAEAQLLAEPLTFEGGAGAGLFAVHREAVINSTNTWIEEDDDTLSPLLFHTQLEAQREIAHSKWMGEDVDFCRRLRIARQPMHVFFLPDVTHDGASNARHMLPALPPAKPST